MDNSGRTAGFYSDRKEKHAMKRTFLIVLLLGCLGNNIHADDPFSESRNATPALLDARDGKSSSAPGTPAKIFREKTEEGSANFHIRKTSSPEVKSKENTLLLLAVVLIGLSLAVSLVTLASAILFYLKIQNGFKYRDDIMRKKLDDYERNYIRLEDVDRILTSSLGSLWKRNGE